MKTQEAIEWAGGTQMALANKLDIKQASVARWAEYPPALRQLQIQKVSGGELQAEPTVQSLFGLAA